MIFHLLTIHRKHPQLPGRLARHLGGRARAPLLDVERLEHGQRRRARRVEYPQVAEDGAERPSVGGVERDAAVDKDLVIVGDGGVVEMESAEPVEETPGFTTVTMVIALLAAVLLARRKD